MEPLVRNILGPTYSVASYIISRIHIVTPEIAHILHHRDNVDAI